MERPTAGPYALQAAIAAVHDEAASTKETDWRRVLELYERLERLVDTPLSRSTARRR